MYNGIGLTTPRGSGTNGHVQRNWAFVRPGKKDNSNYRSEEDIKKLDASLNRPPNKDILDHDRKRKIEVKCLEFEEILEKQGLSSDDIKAKVDSYRQKLMGQGKTELPKDEFGRIAVRDTHQIAEAQQEKNAKLREAFNISEYFIEGSSFDSDRKAKEELAKSLALQKELDAQREQVAVTAAKEKETSKRYGLVHTPSVERDVSSGGIGGNNDHSVKKKRKKKTRDSSVSPDRKKEKKKKSKKRKKESKSKKSKKERKRKCSESDSNADNDKDSIDEESDSSSDAEIKKTRKKSKKDKKKRDKKNKKKEYSSSSEKSRSITPLHKAGENKRESKKIEIVSEKKLADNPFRSRSKEKSYKTREPRRNHYESSQERYNRRSCSRNNKDINKRRSRSRSYSNKVYSNQRSRNERDSRNDTRRSEISDSYVKRTGSSTDYCSRERNDRDHIKYRDSEIRRSRSPQRSNTNIHFREHKRKHSEDRLDRQEKSHSVEKRMKYSQSPSKSHSRRSCEKRSYPRSTDKKRNSSVNSSKSSRNNSADNRQLREKNSKTRSRSVSLNKNDVRKSSTPPPRKSNTNSLNNDRTDGANFNKKMCKDTKGSRSRTASTSSSNSGSSTDTESSRSRTPSPKKEHLGSSVSRSIESHNHSLRRTKSPSLRKTPSPVTKRSTSIHRSISRSRLPQRESKEKGEEYKEYGSRTPPPYREDKKSQGTRSSRDSSELSYSPARRNPERYRDILETSKNQRSLKPKDELKKDITKSAKQSEEREKDRKEKGVRNSAKPVVHLQSQSEDESDTTERNAEKILDEFQESKRERELKDLKMLEQLKTGIAAKAKEKIKTIEKMAASTSKGSSSNNAGEPLVAALADSSLVDAIVSKVSTATVAAAESAARRSRSRSRNRHEDRNKSGTGGNGSGGGAEREGNRRRSTSHSRSSRSSSSSRSRTRSRSRRSSRSHSSQSSTSSRSSSRSSSSSSFGSSRSGTRSPSIPRRRGSPSFLDRRRITSRYSSSRDRRH